MSDHTFGDAAIQALHDPAMPIQFVAPSVDAASSFFAINTWPTDLGKVDLGGRILDIVPIPGHDKYAIALYDRKTGIVLTGDNLYPGRLYIPDFPTYQASTERLIAFLEGKPVAHVLGNHIEQSSTPFLDFPIGSIYHPHEHCLELTFGTLLELEDGLKSMHGVPHRLATRDFTIWPTRSKRPRPRRRHGRNLQKDAGRATGAQVGSATERVRQDSAERDSYTEPDYSHTRNQTQHDAVSKLPTRGPKSSALL
jgi:hydroxyacylglutathione hydrolase